MQFIKTYRSELLWSLLILVVLLFTGLAYQQSVARQKIDTFVKRSIQDDQILIHTVIHNLNRQADLIFELKINQPSVLKLLHRANDPDHTDNSRQRLRDLLQPTYELLEENGIRQFHFHLPGGVSFLRFHRPEKYGDSLQGVRHSIEQVNQQRKVVRGFEEGRVFNGYRNVYPLFYRGAFIGTVEISYSLSAIALSILQEDNAFHGLLIHRAVVRNKVWHDDWKHYIPSKLSPEYLWDREAIEDVYAHRGNLLDYRVAEKALQKAIQPLLGQKKPFLLPLTTNQGHYIAIFHPQKNLQDQLVGYVVSLHENEFFPQAERHMRNNRFIIVTFSLILALLIFAFLKQERDIKLRLESLSNYDALTGLLNRRGFEAAYQAAVARHQRDRRPCSLLFVDIDHFKRINDTHGHDIGDRVLQKLGRFLRARLRKVDIIARWGGEEFVILLSDSDLPQAGAVAENLRRAVDGSRGGGIPHYTVSIGVATGCCEKPMEQLLKEADEALYLAKRHGRNRVEVQTPA